MDLSSNAHLKASQVLHDFFFLHSDTPASSWFFFLSFDPLKPVLSFKFPLKQLKERNELTSSSHILSLTFCICLCDDE